MKTLIIIPAFNEEANIEKVVDKIITEFPQYDYLVVNDGSTDRTAAICLEKGYSFVSLPLNLGIGGAVQTGYLYAAENGYDYTVQLDGDGQHNPEYIAGMIEKLEKEKLDMVIGSRFITNEGFQSTGMRQFGIKLISLMVKMLTGVTVKDVTSGFRVCNKPLTAFFSENYADDYPEPEAIVSAIRNGFRVSEAPVIMNEREGGKSSIFGFKSAYYMIKVSLALIITRLARKEKTHEHTS